MMITAYTRSLGIGAASGLRTFSGPAATLATGDSVWTGIVTTLALGEFVGDLLPFIPARISPPSLFARIVSGGACGGELAARGGGRRAIGALVGASAAVASAFIGYSVRRALTTRAGLSDVPVALIEDGITVALARVATI